jgi:predicted RNase H-like HicB family nuclease
LDASIFQVAFTVDSANLALKETRKETREMRVVVLYPGEDGYWIAECSSLPGCISQGSTKPEALTNIKEAIDGWLETAEAHGQWIPEGAQSEC